jgi:hypothetical protein
MRRCVCASVGIVMSRPRRDVAVMTNTKATISLKATKTDTHDGGAGQSVRNTRKYWLLARSLAKVKDGQVTLITCSGRLRRK